MRNTWSTMIITLPLLLACQPDESTISLGPHHTPENRAPEDFQLITPEQGALHQALRPQFSWQASTDPDGERVVYDVFLNKVDQPDKKVVENILETQVTLTEDLELFGKYSWKVVAKDEISNQQSSLPQRFTVDPLRYMKKASINCVDSGGRYSELKYDEYERLVELNYYENGEKYQGSSWMYDTAGKVEQILYENGIRYLLYYDDQERCTHIAVEGENGRTQMNLQYDQAGRITSATQPMSSGYLSYTLSYSDNFSRPAEIQIISQTILGTFRTRLELFWDSEENLAIIMKYTAKNDEPFALIAQISFTYDHLKNPLYTIIKDLNLPVIDYDLGSNYGQLHLFEWSSPNNVLEQSSIYYEVPEENRLQRTYEYNPEGYPIKMLEENGGDPLQVCFTYES